MVSSDPAAVQRIAGADRTPRPDNATPSSPHSSLVHHIPARGKSFRRHINCSSVEQNVTTIELPASAAHHDRFEDKKDDSRGGDMKERLLETRLDGMKAKDERERKKFRSDTWRGDAGRHDRSSAAEDETSEPLDGGRGAAGED
jgi:hypothetical protein|tara:strand:- start:220 stop:651 length:432 start_codon:yes stop_codon:yes gene_type:complete